MNSLGERIKFCRLKKRFTQIELATLLGVKRESVSGYESGRINPTVTTIISLCKIFDVTSDYLLGIQEESKQNIH